MTTSRPEALLYAELEAQEAMAYYSSTIEEIEAEKLARTLPWVEPATEALQELAQADWQRLSAPRFEPGLRPACADHPNPDWWFSGLTPERVEAAKVCSGCPVRQDCEMASVGEEQGIWGEVPRDGLLLEALCPAGHDDWRINPDTGHRKCLECRRQSARNLYARRRASLEAA